MVKIIDYKECGFHHSQQMLDAISTYNEEDLQKYIDNRACRWCQVLYSMLTREQVLELARQIESGEISDDDE